jgi:hypothetical protein
MIPRSVPLFPAAVALLAALWCLVAGDAARAQTVYLPLRHPAYDFLDRLEARYGVTVLQFARPLPRRAIAQAFDSLARSGAALTPYDREQLVFYRNEFDAELAQADVARGDTATREPHRWHLFSLRSAKPASVYLAADLVGAAAYRKRQDAKDVLQRSNGVQAWGTVGDHLGGFMRWYDNGSNGIPYDARSRRTPAQGVVKGPGSGTSWEFEVAEGQCTYSTDGLEIGVQKMDLWQGSGRFGSIIVSDKAPSVPRVSFTLHLTDWLVFEYAHHWLFSDSLDFSRTYTAGDRPVRFYETKYFATHHISARPLPNLQVTFGESIIYSGGDVNVLFLLPVISFRAADRWTRSTTGNSQFFGDVRYTPLRGITVYGSGFIDELDISKVFTPSSDYFNYHVAYTVGGLFTDLGRPLLRLASETQVEFSRTYPFVYTNGTPTQQYTSHSVTLGHWIGQNADILTLRHTVHPLRALAIALGLSLRRFGNGTKGPYTDDGILHQPAFLYEYEYSDQVLSARVEWVPWHDLSIAADLTHLSRTEGAWYSGAPDPVGLSLGIRVSYGVW